MEQHGWTTPAAEEIRMDAEIGSYQADDEERDDAARFGVVGKADPG